MDALRALHGYDLEEFNWFLRRKGKVVGRRFDHIFCSKAIQPVSCEYRRDVREAGWSDHAAIWAELRLKAPA